MDSPDKADVLVEADLDNSGVYVPVDDWQHVTYAAGGEWRDGWHEPTPGRGRLTFANSDDRWSSWSVVRRSVPHPIRVHVNGRHVVTSQLQPTSPAREGRPRFGIAGDLQSANRDGFARSIEWASIEPASVYDSFRELLGRYGLPIGSVVLGGQDAGIGGWDSTLRGWLSQFSRLAGAWVGEELKGNIDCIHWGRAVEHVGLDVDLGDADERQSVAYRRDLRTDADIRSTGVFLADGAVMGTVDQQVLPDETVIITVKATSSHDVIDAQWHDPEPYLGLDIAVVTKLPRSLVLRVTNTTDTIIPYQIDFTGDAVYAVDRERRAVLGPYAGDIPDDTMVFPSWFADGQQTWGEHTFGYFHEGVAWGRFTFDLDVHGAAAQSLQPGVVFRAVNGDSLDLPTTIWLCYRTELTLDRGARSTIVHECVGLNDPAAGARWGTAIWGQDRWVSADG